MSPSEAAVDEAEPEAATKPAADAIASETVAALSPEALQQLLSDAVRAYAARIQDGEKFRTFPAAAGVTATDVMITATAMLKAVNLQLFELGMWQAWSGNY